MDRHVGFLQCKYHFLPDICPVGYIVIHEGAMVREDLIFGFDSLTDRGKLDITIRFTFITPENGVENHTAVADVDTTRSTVAASVINDVRTDTVISRNGSMVDCTTFGEIDTTTFCGSCIIIDNASRGEWRIIAIGTQRIFSGHMTYSQTTTATRRIARDMTMSNLAVIVHTNTTAVTLNHTDAGTLATHDLTELDYTAAVHIDTSASHGSITALHDTVAQLRIAHHVSATTISRMLTESGITSRSITAGYHTAINPSRCIQRLIVPRSALRYG